MIKQDCSITAIKKLGGSLLGDNSTLFNSHIDMGRFNTARIMTEDFREKYPKSRKAELLDSLVTDLCV